MQRANKNSDRASQAEAATQTKRRLDEDLLTELSLQTSIFKSHDSSFLAFFFFFFFIFSGFSPIHFSSSMPNWATHVAAKHATTATTATTAIRLLCTGQAIGLKPSSGRTKREKR